MSKLNRLLGNPEEVTIKGEIFKIYPLKVKHMNLFREGMSREEQIKSSYEIIKASLQDTEITDEEIDNMDLDSFTKLMDAINKINGFAEDERINRIREAQKKAFEAGAK